jgi:IMP dehydrogenase/GMP reductase
MISVCAGVGGIAGGNTSFQKGSHVLFQRDSTWVNVLYSRTLCHDGHDYEAIVKKCAIYEPGDERKCKRFEKYKAFQPIDGLRDRCKRKEDDTCVEWETVRFFQSPKKIVEIKGNDDEIKKVEKVIIPKCK